MARGATSGTRLVLLGTAGERRPTPLRSGTSQAVVVNDRAYVVDCGNGVGRQLVRSRLLWRLHQVFITHLHSDHHADLFNLFLLGWATLEAKETAFHVFGPGPAGGPPPLPPEEPAPPRADVVEDASPTPGIVDILAHQARAHAYDISVGMRDGGLRHLLDMVVPHEIAVPEALGASGPHNVAPPMEPMLVTEDDAVRVTAILVSHPPVFPSFAYRFDSEEGSIVVSGDTTPSPNLVRLAKGADLLVHEVMDPGHDRARPDSPAGEAARSRLLASHTSRHDVGKVAAEAGVGKLVLSHFIPGWGVPEHLWVASARDHFDGQVIMGEDLLEVHL